MPAPLDVQFGGSGSDVAAVDKFGNLTLAGAANIGKWIALTPQAAAPIQIPGELVLWTPDGATLSAVTPAGVNAIMAAPTVALSAPVTVTGTIAKTTVMAGSVLPATIPAAGATYRIVAWGALTTTLAAQTVNFEVDLGATNVFTWSAQQPNSGGTVTGGAWKLEVDVQIQSATSVQASGWDGLNFFFSSLNQQSTTVANAAGQQLTLALTNSATAVSVTCNGAYFERIA